MILIRACEGFDELDACVQLQIETWGIDDREVTPRKTFLLAQSIGGQVIGAFDTEVPDQPATLIGFAFALPAIKELPNGPAPYLHSHMLAVRSAWRNRGIGRQLKLAQRHEALSRGIGLMEWTFDPLEIKNSFLNIHRLGAVVRDYRVNFYGVSSSQLQGGLPTDRLVAEWHLDSQHVRSLLEGQPSPQAIVELRIPVPASIYQWKSSAQNRSLALAVQMENRKAFQEAFSQGLAVLGFSLDAQGNGVFELGNPAQAGLASTRMGAESKGITR